MLTSTGTFFWPKRILAGALGATHRTRLRLTTLPTRPVMLPNEHQTRSRGKFDPNTLTIVPPLMSPKVGRMRSTTVASTYSKRAVPSDKSSPTRNTLTLTTPTGIAGDGQVMAVESLKIAVDFFCCARLPAEVFFKAKTHQKSPSVLMPSTTTCVPPEVEPRVGLREISCCFP